MNSKGFTLVELLLTITVLALILAIAIPSYNSISRAVRLSQRNNVIKNIEVAASKYAYDTNETIIFVDKLVEEGYIESDEEDGSINDPLNSKKRLNCYIVEMKKEKDYYRAKFIDGNNYDVNGICDDTKLQELHEDVYITVMNNNSIINNTSGWLNGDVSLKADSNNSVSINCDINKCEWLSSSGVSEDGVNLDLTYVKSVLQSRYTFQYTVYTKDSSAVKRYTASVNLKIDNEIPNIYTDRILISNQYVETTEKVITIAASDGNGSGIAGYYLGATSTVCNSTNLEYQKNNEFLITKNGTYKICVKDNVGNTNSTNLIISKIAN